MNGLLFGHGAAFGRASYPHWASVAFLVAVFLSLTSIGFGQSKDDILAQIQSEVAPEGWEPDDHILYAFTPNDPYYTTGNPAGFPGQWHLNVQNSGAIYDARVSGAWSRDITGQGVIIGFVDDGLQRLHPDLSPNYVAADSWNFGNNTADPSPTNSNSSATAGDGDNHGTSVAGVAAARGGNGLGGTGAAPLAGLAGLRIDFPAQTDQMFVDATLYHSSGANTNIKVKNHSYGIFTTYIPSVAEGNAVITSSNAGTIHVFAAGNERCGGNDQGCTSSGFPVDGDANKKYLQSLQETITVAALASSGIFADYSNWGANIWVTAPTSSRRAGEFRITTTDRTGGVVGTGGYNNSAGGGDNDGFTDLDYTSTFGGTSSASPLVAGIMALGKQVQPNLNVRFAKHLLARTSRLIDAADATPTGGWTTNGAGFHFNENYGFGLIDADEFTRQAVQFSSVTPLVTQTIGTTNVGQTIPDNNLTGISRNFLLAAGGVLEEVEVRLNITHTWRGDLEAFLRSPAGTMSRLMYRNLGDNIDNIANWNFVSNAFWGENPAGTWTLTVRDVYSADIGTWNNFSVLAKMGTLVAVPEPASLMLTVCGIIGMAFTSSRRCQQVCSRN